MDLSKMLRNRAYSQTVSAKEVLESEELREYVSKMAKSITENYTRPPKVQLLDKAEDVAWTDGDNVFITRQNDIVSPLSGALGKIKGILGLLFHEAAHIRYLNFEETNRMEATLQAGKFPGGTPADWPADEVKKMEDLLTKPGWSKVFVALYHELINIAADRHDENAMISAYKVAESAQKQSLVEQCILRVRLQLWARTPTVEQALARNNGKITCRVMLTLLFQYIRFGAVLVRTEETLDSEAVKNLEAFKKDADLASTTDDTKEMLQAITRIILRLMPLMEQQAQSPQQPQSQQGGMSQQGQGVGQQEDQSQQAQGGGSQSSQGQQGGQPQQGSQPQHPQGDTSQSSQGQKGGQSQLPQDSGNSDTQSTPQPDVDDLLNAIQSASKDIGGGAAPQRKENSRGVKGAQDTPPEQQSEADKAPAKGESGQQPEHEHDGTGDQGQMGTADDGKTADGQDRDPSEKGDQSSERKIPGKTEDEVRKERAQSEAEGEDDPLNSLLSHIEQKLKEAKAAKEMEQEMTYAMRDKILTVNAAGPHKNVVVKVLRRKSPGPGEIARYKQTLQEIASVSKAMQRSLQKELQDMEAGTRSRHLEFGPLLEARDAFRPDQRFYASKKPPTDSPKAAVIILVDGSGSMNSNHERLDSARKTAVLLDDFCRGLDFSVMTAIHHANSSRMEFSYEIVSQFDHVSQDDRFRLGQLTPGCGTGCNRDGAAIEVSAGLLAKRPENIKLLFVLSDGQPNHINYGGEKAEEDIRSIIKRYKRMGVEIFGAAIGSDRDAIERIYGDGFFDITNLATLPKTLIKLVKRKIVDLL